MNEFRCYYDDGTITTAEVCPLQNNSGSQLIKSELHIIENVIGNMGFPWLLVVLGLVILFSQDNR